MAEIDVEGHVLYALRNARVKKYPFPHFYAENVFPDQFYWRFLDEIVQNRSFHAVEGRYKGRTFAETESIPGLEFMTSKSFLANVAKIFQTEFATRFGKTSPTVYTDLRLIRDAEGYSIGPHTDAPWKLVSLLFYLPRDGWNHDHGTSIYLPKDPSFLCPGGPHHNFDGFNRIFTAPYLPNTCFGFFKTANSFHGVEPINTPIQRDVLLYNIYDQELYLQTHKPASEQQS